jgi:hypothetical protein
MHEGLPIPARFTITDSDTAARAAVERSRRGEGIAVRGVDEEAAGTGTGGLAAVLGRARERLAAALADAPTRSTRAETGRAPSAEDFAVGVGEVSESRGTMSSSSAPSASSASGFVAAAGVEGAADAFSFSLRAPSAAAAVSAARPTPSFAGRFVTPDEAKDARSERAVDFASEARALRGDGAAGSHAGTDLLNSRCVSLA